MYSEKWSCNWKINLHKENSLCTLKNDALLGKIILITNKWSCTRKTAQPLGKMLIYSEKCSCTGKIVPYSENALVFGKILMHSKKCSFNLEKCSQRIYIYKNTKHTLLVFIPGTFYPRKQETVKSSCRQYWKAYCVGCVCTSTLAGVHKGHIFF